MKPRNAEPRATRDLTIWSSWSSLKLMASKSGYNIYEAKTRLSELVDKASGGEKVILMNRGKPVAMIVPLKRRQRERTLGFLKGRGRLLRGWDRPIEDFDSYR